jgi:hypothetical protein
VPLFVEELTKAVVESGMLTNAGGRYTAAGQVPAGDDPSESAGLAARAARPVQEAVEAGGWRDQDADTHRFCQCQGIPLPSSLAARDRYAPHADAGGARSRAISASMSANICSDTATSA